MAFQLAFYRIHSEPGATYESAATRMFLHGRTETIRSLTCESLEFALKMLDSCVSVEDKAKALIRAVAAHKKYTVDVRKFIFLDIHV